VTEPASVPLFKESELGDLEAGHPVVFVSIDNSDDRLPQIQWSNFCVSVRSVIYRYASVVLGWWLSPVEDQWQNACACFEIRADLTPALKMGLRSLASLYGQDRIVWADATTAWLRPSDGLIDEAEDPAHLRPGVVYPGGGWISGPMRSPGDAGSSRRDPS
jgi:hypothetical protein